VGRWRGRGLGRGQGWNHEGAEAGDRDRDLDAEIPDDMAPERRDGGREACKQGQRLHLHRGGAVAERFLQQRAATDAGTPGLLGCP
jgi:hypothetical protein